MALPASGQLSIGDIATEFEDSAPHAMSEFYGAADGIPSSGAIAISDFYGASNIIPAPVGLIVPYNSASIPSGWSRFTSADNRFIVGAGSSYSGGATGGSSSASFPGTTSSAGSHPASSHPYSPSIASTGGSPSPGQGNLNQSGGGHTHTFNIPVSPSEDAYKNFVLIKCTSSGVQLPQNAMLLATTSLSGVTNVETTTDRFLRSASSYGGTGGSGSLSGSVTSSSSGSHNHGLSNASRAEDSVSRGATSGSHTHTASLSGSLNTKRIYVSAWTNASADYDLVENGIAMWESATPPSGWRLCNGASGAPDLRDFFVRIGTTGNHGTTSGNNSAPWSVSASGSAPHSHSSGGVNASGGVYGNNYSWPHSHSASGSKTIIPPYYALYFIQYTG